MNNEIVSYIKWIFSNKRLFLSWLSKKILKKFLKRYSINYYPRSIKDKIPDREKKINFNQFYYNYKNTLKMRINWFKKYLDLENYEKYHRFFWLKDYKNLSNKTIKSSLAEYAVWNKLFFNDIKNPAITDKDLKWESYTVSERICNYVNIALFLKKKEYDLNDKSIFDQTYYLINRLEYFFDGYGNHIINNARAIFLSSVYFDNNETKNFSYLILKRELPKLLDKNGILREGSSSYQLLITSWLLEIFDFAVLNKQTKFTSLLKNYIEKCISSSSYFIYNEQLVDFGDLTPDLEKKKLLSKIINLKKNYPYCYNYLSKTNIFKLKNLNSIIKLSNYYKFSKYNKTLFLKCDKKNRNFFFDHSHCDFGHFYFFYKNYRVFIDLNRKNYMSKKGVNSDSHNSILLNKVGLFPNLKISSPREYSNSNNKIKYNNSQKHTIIELKTNVFKKIYKQIKWKRKFFLEKRKLEIQDSINGFKKLVFFESYFHLDSKISIRKKTKNTFEITHKEFKEILYFKFNTKQKINSKRINSQFSNNYGKSEKTKSLYLYGIINAPFDIKYQIYN